MARITDLKKPVRRLSLYDGIWYVVTMSKEGLSFKEYRKSEGATIKRSWREVLVQEDLPLFEGEPNANAKSETPTPPTTKRPAKHVAAPQPSLPCPHPES